jgi:hypothetical protein
MNADFRSAPYAVCPYCHTPVPIGSFEHAQCGQAVCRVCPECDQALLLAADPAAGAASPLAERAGEASGNGAERACSTCA